VIPLRVLLPAAIAATRLFAGELVSFPGPWAFQLGKQGIILVCDEELEALAEDPDRVLNLSTGRTPRHESLRQVCKRAQDRGQRTLSLAFDHFFAQYRPGQQTPRQLLPDMDEYIRHIAAISRFAQGFGLGLELSLLSPLEVGKAYTLRTGESGIWMHYREGVRDPNTGAFSVQLWQQRRWANNKGVFEIDGAGVRVFAFRERPIAGTPYRVVDPREIVEIKSGVKIEILRDAEPGDYRLSRRIRIYGAGAQPDAEKLDRVMVVQSYRTPELDYFSPKALPFLTDLVDRYAAAGVKLNGLYSDEMHIQQDWGYSSHHDNGEFALRYVSPGLAREYAARYGAEFQDFAKYLVYFLHGQEDSARDLSAKRGIMHVFGASPEAIRRTALFRARYYRLLQDGVVDLFVRAKHHAEAKMGRKLAARYHATWAQSPTIDFWDVGRLNANANKYEYTSNFLWSNTVHQAASACADYFKWGEFLVGGGNDHTEGGWLDRNYYALALASSTGILNEVPYSYAAHWGMPAEIRRRRSALVDAFGAGASPPFAAVQESRHRDVDVLMLYPLDLVAVEERFGSWMVQYGYANMVTAAKLLEHGRVSGRHIEMAGRRFTTLYAPFEPFPPKALLDLMRIFAAQGGRVIWAGPPPLITFEGEAALPLWQSIFGVQYSATAEDGVIAPGRKVTFEGSLASVPPQTILTDFLVDRIYPVAPEAGTATVARVKQWIVGTHKGAPAGGAAVFLGFRPRDDQSRSLGYDERTLFSILEALGAYPGADNTERLSRTGPYLACRFPNGAIALAPHLRELEEDWPGGFARDEAADRAWLDRHPLPQDSLELRDFLINGRKVTYSGLSAMSFRVGQAGELVAFAGYNASGITVDGRSYRFSAKPLALIAFAPVAQERRVPGGAVMQIMVRGAGTVRIPAPGIPGNARLFAEGPTPGTRGSAVACRIQDGALTFEATPATANRWLYVTP